MTRGKTRLLARERVAFLLVFLYLLCIPFRAQESNS
jgi:hypothetical protein